ncbi:MAG TPA: tail fiber domain-containing protein, partial [Dissulfurispiraceae bacterium]|nr:tail fiber domain-containing protein [Dissulfurispiraceae bacterium]
SNTTGNDNIASGYGALAANTTGNFNTALGTSTLRSQSYDPGAPWDAHNTAVGYQALYNNNPTSTANGTINTAVGSLSMHENTTGMNNSALGVNALYSNQTGSNNTAIGVNALNSSTGNGNTALGKDAGSIAGFTGSNNIYIGQSVAPASTSESNTIRIGSSITATYISGIYSYTASSGIPVYVNSNGQLGTVTSSRRYKEDIKDMGEASSLLMKLRPVTFHYKNEYANDAGVLQYGLIAEEVAEINHDLVQYDNAGRPQSVYYHLINAMLLNEVQKQQRQIREQKDELAMLKERLARLEDMLGKR